MSVSVADLQDVFEKLGAALGTECTLVAAGGTALTLQGIKSATKDIDFIVECGPFDAAKAAVQQIQNYRIDLFPSGYVFNNLLPQEYLARAIHIGRFHKLSVHAMSALDVTMTKIARANQNDIDDISLCARHGITSSDIINAARSYGIDTPELRNNLRRVLHRVFGIVTSELEEDRR